MVKKYKEKMISMKIIKKIIGKIEYLIYVKKSLKIIKKSSKNNIKKIYLMGIPVHGNLGDQAIVIAERKFLKDNFSDYNIIEVESEIVLKKLNFLKKYIDNSLILIHGGGFIGTLWPKEDKMSQLIIDNFDNNMIFLPQTAYFENNQEGIKLVNELKEKYKRKKNLFICLREKYSYEFMKENFQGCNLVMIPDMVLYLDNEYSNKSNKCSTIIMCLRNDIEKKNIDTNKIKNYFEKNSLNDINYTDTVINKRLYHYNREKYVSDKIKEFAASKLVVTDRLHGMVFAYLANTPCLVVNSKSHKVKGVYEWISNDKKIRFIDNANNCEKDIEDLLKAKKRNVNEKQEYKKCFDELIKIIKKYL